MSEGQGSMALAGDKRHLVVISDVHLGTLGPTVWYQPHLHEPYLLRLLAWVEANAASVRELVLLGDIVELWSYPADEDPPTFADIVAAHPAVLGPAGALARLVDALDGAVTYVPGNHDMGVSADDVAVIRGPASGLPVRHTEEVPYVPAPGVAMAHGHHWTLFNAPAHGPWGELPLGYFVTRAVATRWKRELGEGKTVADLAGQGAPNGIDLGSLGRIASGAGARSVAATVLDFVTGATGIGLDLEVRMPGGGTANLHDAREVFVDTWSDWAEAEGGGIVGQASAARAALADLDGSCLPWFAQRLGLQHDVDLVVMGHTHVPISGIEAGFVDYANSGFDCPSEPDMAREASPQRVTFAVVDLGQGDDEPTASIWGVDHDGCRPVDAPRQRITVSPAQDRSCYVTLDNSTSGHAWERVEVGASQGTWVVEPPHRLEVGQVARCWLQDLVGPSGSAGHVSYRRLDDPAAPVATFSFSCPVVGTNAASGPGSLATRVAEEPWHEERIAYWGHPFFVDLEVR